MKDIAILKNAPLFRHLSVRDLKRLAAHARVRRYKPGADIVKEGQAPTGLYIIISGHVEVIRGPRDSVLAELKAGDFFGETALLTRHPRVATVRAAAPTRCVLIWRTNFKKFLMKHPEITIKMLGTLLDRLAAASLVK